MNNKQGSNLCPTIKLTNDFAIVLSKAERHGIGIDLPALQKLKKECEDKLEVLSKEINELVHKVTGGYDVNFDSPDQLSQLVYSRRVTDKSEWKSVFNIGSETRGAVTKPKRRNRYADKDYIRIVRTLTEVTRRYSIQKCSNSCVRGRVKRSDKRRVLCPVCDGKGFERIYSREISGFRVVPDQEDVSAAGWSTDKGVLQKLKERATNADAKSFFEKMVERNQISHYLSTFIAGIERNTGRNSVLHTQFMQAVTATGRLSSQEPNFQNLKRGSDFPIRRVVVSKFRNGKILEGDFKQLEFRAAGELSGCHVVAKTVADNIDVHAVTAGVIGCSRQDAKPHTFKPLYGGSSGTDKERAYYEFFAKHYSGVGEWHKHLINEALTTGVIVLPTGREYAFPGVKRYPSGYVNFSTQIKNYPVQGFATADIVPASMILVDKLLTQRKLLSHCCLTVHDSIVIDTHPDEIPQALECLAIGMGSVKEIMKLRYGIDLIIPIEAEYKIGDNLLDMKEIKYG